MIVATSRNVGDRFWVPRVYEDSKDEEIVVNGKTYQRYDTELVSEAKEKLIVEIYIKITSTGVNQSYVVVSSKNGVQDHMFRQHIDADDRMFDNPDEALQFAIDWKNKHQKPYFGKKS